MPNNFTDIDFRGQFKLSCHPGESYPGWASDTVKTWSLQHCPTLPVHHLLDSGGRPIGWLLGYAITPTGYLQNEPVRLAAPQEGVPPIQGIEDWISALAGRYVAIVATDHAERVYTDPAGQLSVVYDAKNKLVGSSLYLVSEFEEPSGELPEFLNIPTVDAYYPFGLTPKANVLRLLPNHYLDLQTFESKRHWPTAGEFSGRIDEADPQSIVSIIAAKLERNIQAVVREYPAHMSLTAGQDSRMLLAAARQHIAQVRFFTNRIPDQAAALDCKISCLIAKKARIQYEVIEWLTPSARELERWQIRVGRAGAGRTWKSVRTLSQLSPDRVFMPGLCGEVGRGYFWREEDLEKSGIDPEMLLSRMHLPSHPIFIKAVEQWKADLGMEQRTDILDFGYIEHRLGCWAGPSHYGHINNPRVIPLSDRAIFALMLRLPAHYRFEQKMAGDLISQLWPELLGIPFNRDIGVVAAFKRARHIVRPFLIRALETWDRWIGWRLKRRT